MQGPISPRKTDCLMIFKYFRVTVLDYTDLFSISLHGDDIQDFDTRLDQAPLSTKELPKDSILESLCKMRIRESVQLQTVSRPNYPKLKTMVRRHIDQMIRTRNFKVRNQRVETEVLIKTQTVKMSALSWKAKGQCSQGDARTFRHDDSKRGKNTQSSSLAPRPQTQNDGRRPSKGSAPRGSGLSGRRCQRGCRNYLEETGTSPSCDDLASSRMSKLQNLIRIANSSKSAYSGTLRLTVGPAKSQGKVVEKDLLAY